MARLNRLTPGVLLSLLGIGMVLTSASASLTWITAELIPGFSVSSVEATGLQLMPALAAVVLFGLAAIFVLWYSKALVRRILCAAMIALFGSQLFSLLADVLLNPSGAIARTPLVTKVTGIGDVSSEVKLLVGTQISVAAWLCAMLLLAVIAICLVIAFRNGVWVKTNRRIEKKSIPETATEPVDLWDSQA